MKTAIVLRRILPPLWCGMLLATALEAQLKFQAPGITRELGLGIGKIVFTALNRAECVIAVLLAIALFAFAAAKTARIIFAVTAAILLAQTFWLIPLLIDRIDAIVGGRTPPASAAHLFYIAFETVKIAFLLFLSVSVNRSNDETGH